MIAMASSPRERGWSRMGVVSPCGCQVVPARAGIVRDFIMSNAAVGPSSPRERG